MESYSIPAVSDDRNDGESSWDVREMVDAIISGEFGRLRSAG